MAYKCIAKQPLSFTLNDGTEFILVHGKSYDLPQENAYIRGLEAQGYLEQVPEPPKPKRKQNSSQIKR